ncbi:hypothetical protein NMY22_g1592 [Coprinellus aureogranulatus]|nr:hypothetical protein NMY22_g1592 [Coprinellus aureogranulatus]
MSTTTKLWATGNSSVSSSEEHNTQPYTPAASKEWVIPSKPKPGRKPKKDVPQEDAGDPDEAKGRRIQNRAAQRAFRERKQSQLAELQARILSYEQGEIERNVALQNIAKRLKEENDKLRQENQSLKEAIAKLEQEKQEAQQQLNSQSSSATSESKEKKRWRDESPAHQTRQTRKRTRTSATPPATADASSHSSPASTVVATPESTGLMSPSQMDSSQPLPPPPQPVFDITSADMDHTGLNDMLDFSSSMKVVNMDTSFPQFDCGFCTETSPCVCRELALNQLTGGANQDLLGGYKEPSYLNTVPHPSLETQTPPTQPTPSSILENLPAYQPPVPLRRKSSKQLAKSIFPVFPAPAQSSRAASTSTPTCSGDPSNCAACSDDAFGKAFCSAIEETVNTRAVCENCPSRNLDGPLEFARTGTRCCGGLSGCGSCPSRLPGPPATATTVIQYEQESPQDYIPTNDAWQRIKEHPNVQFADLSLLAEVVASRSTCTGPRIVITPPPDYPGNQGSQDGVGHYNGHPRVKQEAPRLVPQEVLLECGRRRVREVHSDAVREALRLLDAKFT